MTNDEIINLAIENTIHGLKFDEEGLLRFAKLIAQHEREACIEDIMWHVPRSGRDTPEYQRAMKMIERIRARGQA